MSADFSKLMAALAKANEDHADRDGLTGVRRAIYLDRGRHAPGEVCPSAKDQPKGERAWCFTCERWHQAMEWGEGCATERGNVPSHHRQRREVAPGVWEIARPLRDTSWWHRWRAERACRKATGHCWHPDGFVDWWCCMCSADTDGMPEHRCTHCLTAGATP